MPYRPKTPCHHPGCPELVEAGRFYCEKHLPLHPEATRPAAKRGYNRRWQKARKSYLEAHPLCVECMKNGRFVRATVVDTYVQNLCSIIERWNLAQYNVVSGSTTISGWYRVRKSWQNAASQKGAFHDLTYAKQCADANPGYVVFDPAGKAVYPVTQTSSVPYAVRVSINDLNIRKGPGTNYAKTGQYTGKGVFTIVAESAGAGSKKGWGKLKSGAGWVSLDFCTRVG